MEVVDNRSDIQFLGNPLLRNLGFGVLALSILAVCFTPSDLMFTRLENFLLPLLLFLLAVGKRIKFEAIHFLALAAFSAFYVVSMFLNGEGLGDVSYAIRSLKILLFLVFGAQLLYLYKVGIDKIIRVVFLAIGAIVLLELFNPMGINEVLFNFFTHHDMKKFNQNNSVRIIGTMMNPNDNGVLLSCFIAYFMSAYYYSKNRLNLLLILVGLVLVVLSQSRTSLIAVLAMGVPFILTLRIMKTMIIAVVGSGVLVLAAMYLLKMNYMLELLSQNPLEISAFKARFRDWGYVIEVWSEYKIWGVGPFADTFTAAGYFDPDSEYLYILGSRGIVGLVCYLLILIYPIVLFWKIRYEVTHGLLAVLLSVAFIVIGITNFSILNVRIGVLYAILIAIPFSFYLYGATQSKLNLSIPGLGSLFIKRK